MNDRIVDVYGGKARAAAHFNYRGYWISFSCVFETQVAVFEHIDGDIVKQFLSTVEKAIEFVDNMVDCKL